MAYPSVYPTSLDSYTPKTDGIDDVMAVDVNELQSAIVAVETKLGTGQFHAAAGNGATWGFKAGAALDVLWYRGGAGLWQTPNSLTVDGGGNFGTASGATAGQIRTSGGLMPGSATSHQFNLQQILNLADHGKEQIGILAGEWATVFILDNGTGTMAIYALHGGTHTVAEMADSGGYFTTVEDTDGKANIYWDAANARYELNNELGTTRSFYIFLLRSGTS